MCFQKKIFVFFNLILFFVATPVGTDAASFHLEACNIDAVTNVSTILYWEIGTNVSHRLSVFKLMKALGDYLFKFFIQISVEHILCQVNSNINVL